ncbi:PAS domain S-box protein [bacterium]|nr:PAS domain S-box protein [candidate division CSSED10-310 bacterium]
MTDRAGSDDIVRIKSVFQDIAHYISDSVLIADSRGCVLYMNPQAFKLTGTRTHQITDLRIDELIEIRNPDKQELFPADLLGVQSNCEIVLPANSFFRSHSGQQGFITGKAIIKVLNDGTTLCILVLHRDESYYRSVFNGIPDVIGIQDNRYRVIEYNEAGYRYLNMTPQQVEGKTCFELLGKNNPCNPCATCRCMDTCRPERTEKFVDGTSTWLDCRSYPILDDQGSVVNVIEHLRDITEQKRTEDAMIRMEEDLRTTLNSIGDAVIATDMEDRIIRMNPAAEILTGWNRDEARGKPLKEVITLHRLKGSGRLKDNTELSPADNDIDSVADCLSLKSRDGKVRQISYSRAPMRDPSGKVSGTVIVFRDISNEYRIREELRESEERFRNLAELLPVGLFECDRNLRLTFVNSEALRMFEYTQSDVQNGLNAMDLISEESHAFAEETSRRRFSGEVIPVVEYLCRKKNGTPFPVLLYITAIQNDENVYIGLRGVLIDITRRKELEEELKNLSMRDALTGLYNRAFFEEEMQRLKTTGMHPLSIVVCDIDGLKLINETMGHRKGDELLKVTAEILRKAFKNNNVIARIGGDEFAILLPKTKESITDELCRQVQKETDLYNSLFKDIYVSISVGYAVSSQTASDPTELFKIADHNMYRAKLHQSRSSRSDIIQALVKTLEARDYVADGHAARLQIHVSAIGHKLGLSDARQRDLNILCRFHDLGKVGIPDRILMKKGPLTPEEFHEVKGHCEIGYRIALTVADLAPVADYILKHHESWDGTGYPLGLKGVDIPLESRILAIVDSFDAMTHDRPYQKALTKEAAIKILKDKAGKHFDPYLVDVFLSIIDPR